MAENSYRLMDTATTGCPFDWYSHMRERGGVWRDEESGIYVVASYDLIREATAKPEIFSNNVDQQGLRPGGLPAEALAILGSIRRIPPTMVTNDPPSHGRYKVLVDKAFSPGRVKKMEDYVLKLVDDLIDRFEAAGEVELLEHFAIPLPVGVISDQVGVPRTEMLRVKAWSDAAIDLRGLMTSDERVIECARLMADFQSYFLEQIAARRAEPKDDMLTDLVQAEVAGERPLDDDELLSVLLQLMVAGNESTTNAIASGVMLMCQQPDIQPQIRNDPRALQIFVEEVLRLEGPVQGSMRKCLKETELGGVTIPEGAHVQMRWGAGNRDGCAFANEPDAVDLTRKEARNHLSFGNGIHYCIGANLARSEMRIAFRRLLDRLAPIRFAEGQGERLEHAPSFYLRGLKELRVAWGG